MAEMGTPQREEDVVKAMEKCLENVPFVQIIGVEEGRPEQYGSPDTILRVHLPEGEKRLAIEVKANGQPRIAREAINQLQRWQQTAGAANYYPVFAAPYVTPGTIEICSQEGVGCIDLAGNCRLNIGQTFIQREGRPNPYPEKRALRSLYSPRATRVLRVLLENPGKLWTLQELSKEAQVSLGQVYKVKELLLDREWAKAQRGRFSLTDPQELLQQWAEAYGEYAGNEAHNYYAMAAVPEIEDRVAEACRQMGLEYAFTGFSGAARLAPFVRYQRVTVYLAAGLAEVVRSLGLREASSGANLTILEPYDEGVLYRTEDREGVKVVSPTQLYLDLRNTHGRGEEAADALLEEVIKSRW